MKPMGEANEKFTLLLADIFAAPGERLLFLVDAARDSAGHVLQFGADPLAQLHILAPIPPEYAYTPQRGERIELTEWTHPASGERFMDLLCRAESLAQVFGLMADSVVERIVNRGELCHSALQGALHDWQELLRPAKTMSEDSARGLFGELTVLKLLAARNPIYAVECWTGPDQEKHDFSTPNGDLEVKSSAKEALEVTISSLGQLDRLGGVSLTLVRVQVASSPSGHSIGDLVDELEAMGCLRAEIVHRMAGAGFMLGVDSDDHRFEVQESPIAWEVGPDFPGLRKSDLPEGRREAITRLSYNLSLADAPGQLDQAQLIHVLEWVMAQ